MWGSPPHWDQILPSQVAPYSMAEMALLASRIALASQRAPGLQLVVSFGECRRCPEIPRATAAQLQVKTLSKLSWNL